MKSDIFISLILVLLQTQVNMIVFYLFINQVKKLIWFFMTFKDFQNKSVNVNVNTHTITFLQ